MKDSGSEIVKILEEFRDKHYILVAKRVAGYGIERFHEEERRLFDDTEAKIIKLISPGKVDKVVLELMEENKWLKKKLKEAKND